MREWDLTAGTAKLERALKALLARSDDISTAWSDETNRRFVESYLEPLEPRVKALLDAVRRLAEVLATAQRECCNE